MSSCSPFRPAPSPIFEEREVSEEFREFLHERSEGNPFVLEEMLRDAVDRGDIYRTDSGWDRKALAEMRIPRTVKAAILHRLERLRKEEVDVLSAASVIGRAADIKTLIGVTGMDEATVYAALETCVTYQLLEEDERTSGKYQFRHALTREAVYEDMIVPRRQQLHARVAEFLASRPDGAAVDMAHHLLAAGRYDDAVPMCVAAAEDATRARAYRDAADLLERAAPMFETRSSAAAFCAGPVRPTGTIPSRRRRAAFSKKGSQAWRLPACHSKLPATACFSAVPTGSCCGATLPGNSSSWLATCSSRRGQARRWLSLTSDSQAWPCSR
ncbi:MAG TPA: hypothetical protein VN985_00845 [Candidatus Eisenbacteria bacterium]|nr:hypothetical protein [Candidatus Eisenbacteria bacterium]